MRDAHVFFALRSSSSAALRFLRFTAAASRNESTSEKSSVGSTPASAPSACHAATRRGTPTTGSRARAHGRSSVERRSSAAGGGRACVASSSVRIARTRSSAWAAVVTTRWTSSTAAAKAVARAVSPCTTTGPRWPATRASSRPTVGQSLAKLPLRVSTGPSVGATSRLTRRTREGQSGSRASVRKEETAAEAAAAAAAAEEEEEEHCCSVLVLSAACRPLSLAPKAAMSFLACFPPVAPPTSPNNNATDFLAVFALVNRDRPCFSTQAIVTDPLREFVLLDGGVPVGEGGTAGRRLLVLIRRIDSFCTPRRSGESLSEGEW
mmetsp:Transcript_6854/g.22034  ORF Transcript_6854/g.22034 Transcript_6854/m.22034 type:complete len:322 (+) Transcript_6854:233-1198(+)